MNDRAPFIVLSLPRSRSAWAAHFLSYPGRLVGHDIAIECDEADQFIKSFSLGMDGTCETGAMIGWRLLRHHLPSLKTMVVFREPMEVYQSLGKFVPTGEDLIYDLKSKFYLLDAISSCPGVRSMHWTDWSEIHKASQAFEWLLDLPFDFDWWAEACQQKIEVDFPKRVMRLIARQPQIAALKSEILSRQLSLGASGCPVFN